MVFIQRRLTDYHTWSCPFLVAIASAPHIHSYSRMWVWDSFRPNAFLKHYTLKDTLSHSIRIWHWYFKSVFWLLGSLKLCIKQIEQNLTVWADRLLTSSNSRKCVHQGFVGGLLKAWNTMYIFNFTTMESSHMLLTSLDLFPSEVIIMYLLEMRTWFYSHKEVQTNNSLRHFSYWTSKASSS